MNVKLLILSTSRASAASTPFQPWRSRSAYFFLVVESKAAQFRLDYGPEDIAAAFFDDCIQLCRKLAVVEDVYVHQVLDQLRGTVVTPREAHSTPSAFRTVERA